MNPNANNVKATAEEVVTLVEDALEWVGDQENDNLVGNSRVTLVRALRKDLRRARILARAAGSKMCVSVFGPSQAGKSYLISVLGRPEGGRLVANYAGRDGQLDYISQINPEGEGESTGLVTRFTMTEFDTPEGFPIPIRLLGEADLIRTILNSFYMDGDRKDPLPDANGITTLLQTAAKKQTDRGDSGITEDEVWGNPGVRRREFRRCRICGRNRVILGGGCRDRAESLDPRIAQICFRFSGATTTPSPICTGAWPRPGRRAARATSCSPPYRH